MSGSSFTNNSGSLLQIDNQDIKSAKDLNISVSVTDSNFDSIQASVLKLSTLTLSSDISVNI